MSFNFAIYGYRGNYLDNVFVSFKDCFMAECNPSLILLILKNSNQIPNTFLLKVSNKDTDLI